MNGMYTYNTCGKKCDFTNDAGKRYIVDNVFIFDKSGFIDMTGYRYTNVGSFNHVEIFDVTIEKNIDFLIQHSVYIRKSRTLWIYVSKIKTKKCPLCKDIIEFLNDAEKIISKRISFVLNNKKWVLTNLEKV